MFLCSDDYNAELDSWVLQLASTPEQDSSSVNIIHRRSGCALTYIAHVLECKYKPDDTLKDGVWRLRYVWNMTHDPFVYERHVEYYLAVP